LRTAPFDTAHVAGQPLWLERHEVILADLRHAVVVDIRLLESEELSDDVRAHLRTLLWDAFDDFSEDDWCHGLGGVHVVAFTGGRPVGHASVISRKLYVGNDSFVAGYLEAVAVEGQSQGRGIGAQVVRAAGEVIVERFPVAALSTSKHRLYEGLGWERWLGASYVVSGEDWQRTEDEDAGVMVLRPPGSPVTDLHGRIGVEDRSGDAW
jgi:aminoglycoside 2'-N-acetyltransferase I